MKIKVAIIGFGRMGRFYLQEFQKSTRYDVVYICDINESCCKLAHELSPSSKVITNSDVVFDDPNVQLVVLSAFASDRRGRIALAVSKGKHIIAEKPIADTVEAEEACVQMTENYDGICTVNMYLRNSWYHSELKDIVASGELGDLAILRICHMTPGLAPGDDMSRKGRAFTTVACIM